MTTSTTSTTSTEEQPRLWLLRRRMMTMPPYCQPGMRHCENPTEFNVFSREDGAATIAWPPIQRPPTYPPSTMNGSSSNTESPTSDVSKDRPSSLPACVADGKGNFGSATLKRDQQQQPQPVIQQQLVAYDYRIQTTPDVTRESLNQSKLSGLEQRLAEIVADSLLTDCTVVTSSEEETASQEKEESTATATKSAVELKRASLSDDENDHDRALFVVVPSSLRFLQNSPVTGLKPGPDDYVLTANTEQGAPISSCKPDSWACFYTVRGAFTILGSAGITLKQEALYRENDGSNDKSLASAIEPALESTEAAMTDGQLDQVDESILGVTFLGPISPDNFNPPTVVEPPPQSPQPPTSGKGPPKAERGEVQGGEDNGIWRWYLVWGSICVALLIFLCIGRRRRQQQRNRLIRVENNYSHDDDDDDDDDEHGSTRVAAASPPAVAARGSSAGDSFDNTIDNNLSPDSGNMYIPGAGEYHSYYQPQQQSNVPTSGVATLATEIALQAQQRRSADSSGEYDDNSDIFDDVARATSSLSASISSTSPATIPTSNRARTLPTSNVSGGRAPNRQSSHGSIVDRTPESVLEIHDRNVFRVIHPSSEEESSSSGDDRMYMFRDRGSSDDDDVGGFPRMV